MPTFGASAFNCICSSFAVSVGGETDIAELAPVLAICLRIALAMLMSSFGCRGHFLVVHRLHQLRRRPPASTAASWIQQRCRSAAAAPASTTSRQHVDLFFGDHLAGVLRCLGRISSSSSATAVDLLPAISFGRIGTVLALRLSPAPRRAGCAHGDADRLCVRCRRGRPDNFR